MAELNPRQISTFLEWFKTTQFAKHYEDEIAGVAEIHSLLDEVKAACPAAGDICQQLKNRYEGAFYKELKEDHRNWIKDNKPEAVVASEVD